MDILEVLPSLEIEKTLQKAALFGGKLIHPTSSHNQSLDIHRIDVDQNGKLFIRLRNDLELEGHWPVSIRLNYREISFQLENYNVQGNLVVGNIPTKARALPLRIAERYLMPRESQVLSSLYRVEKRGGTLDTKARILDVSKNGLGIIFENITEEDLLRANDHVWIKNIHHMTLESPIFAHVIYAFERKFTDAMDLKVGLKLDESLPLDLLFELQEMSHLVLKG